MLCNFCSRVVSRPLRSSGRVFRYSTEKPTGPTHYEILQVAEDASDKEIKNAYLRLSKMYHPDANPENEDAAKMFQEIAGAYEALKTPKKRAAYDSQRLGKRQYRQFDDRKKEQYERIKKMQESGQMSLDDYVDRKFATRKKLLKTCAACVVIGSLWYFRRD